VHARGLCAATIRARRANQRASNEVAEPNPIWGLHLAPGAIAGALVMRTDAGHEVLETFTSVAPSDAAGLRAAAVALLGRRGIRGRAVLVAAADHACTVRTGQIPSEELYLNDEEIFHQLHDFAPFEPGEGHLAYVGVGKSDARRFLLAGIPFSAHDEIEKLAGVLDLRYHGIGLATPAMFLGASALGLVGDRGYLIDVQARVTLVLAAERERLRRYLLPVGAEQCAESPDTAALLATDILRATSYHVEQARREAFADDADQVPDIVFVGPMADRARELLGPALGMRLADPALRHGAEHTVTGTAEAPLDDATALACVGAIGAALEAFRLAEERLVLRHPPSDVPEYYESHSGRWLAAAVVVLVAAALAVAAWAAFSGDGEERDDAGIVRDSSASPAADGSEAAARAADAARDALENLALREAGLRCAVAAAAALRSGVPAHESRSFVLERTGDTMSFALVATVGRPISERLRRDARAAVEAVPGIEQIEIDLPDGALRVRARASISRSELPEPGDDDRVSEPRLLHTADSGSRVERLSGMSDPERVARVLLGTDGAGGAPVALTAAEQSFATARFAAISELIELLPRANDAPRLVVAGQEGGAVTVRVDPPLSDPAVLERRRLPDGVWTTAGTVDAGAADFTDDVPGASGRYAWRLRIGDAVAAPPIETQITIDVELELVAVGGTPPVATFVLRRVHGGRTIDHSVTVAAREPIRGTSDPGVVVFESGLALESIVARTEIKSVTNRVPRFLPDGTIERDAGGSPVFVERPGTRSITVFDVSARDADGEPRTWVQEMTDR